MKNLSFVNIFGQPLSIPPLSAEPRPLVFKRAKTAGKRKKPANYHKGWRVVGVSPDQILAARCWHEKNRVSAFNEERWVNKARQKRARIENFESQEAARQYAELARRAGWKRVEVREIRKDCLQDCLDMFSGFSAVLEVA